MAARPLFALVSLLLVAAVAAVLTQAPPPAGAKLSPPTPSEALPVAAATDHVETLADARRSRPTDPHADSRASLETPASPASEGSGLRVYVDPETGRFVPVPVAGAEAEAGRATAEALSNRSADLVEQESPVPGGGVMLDLQGRFQNAIEMSVDASGELSSDCASEAAPDATGDEGVRR